MLDTRHEEFKRFTDGLPFVFHTNLKRTSHDYSKENNWHDNLEIQLCVEGSGTVLLDGERIAFNKNDIVVVNSNVIHYTGTDTSLVYSCLIVSTEFCRQIGLDPAGILFSSHIKSDTLVSLFSDLTAVYKDVSAPCRIARLNKIVLEILIEIAENYTLKETPPKVDTKSFETVKAAISFIRENYQQKITLDEIATAVLCDKYALCRQFKRLTGQTIVEHLNGYRCIKAIDYLNDGYSVAQTALCCGFDNLSFFTKTFKKYIGKLPSEYKK